MVSKKEMKEWLQRVKGEEKPKDSVLGPFNFYLPIFWQTKISKSLERKRRKGRGGGSKRGTPPMASKGDLAMEEDAGDGKKVENKSDLNLSTSIFSPGKQTY